MTSPDVVVIGHDGEPAWHRNDDLVRSDPAGLPDYTDPVICPVLWPQGE